MKYLLAFLVLSVVIIIHELGHFIVAKASGVTVTEFSIGMGPRLIKFTRKGTMYSLKLFIFGGSCRMLGEDEDDNSDGTFNSKSVWKRIAIIAAGPVFNFILAFVGAIILIGSIGYDPAVLYSVEENSPAYEAGLRAGDHIVEVNGKNVNFYGDYSLYMYDHEGDTLKITYERDGKEYTTVITPDYIDEDVYQMGVYISVDAPVISEVIKDTPAYEAGLKKGDKVLSIDGKEVVVMEDISKLVQKCGGKPITLLVERDGEEVSITFTPNKVRQTYYDYGYSFSGERVKCSPAGTVKYAFKNVGYWIKAVFKSLGLMITGHVSLDDVAGPVGIVSTMGEVVEEASSDGAYYVFINLLNWCVMISANLGVMNLLPIPALDGGRLVFLGIEAVRRKPVPRDKEGMVHFIGIVLLMILMVVILFNDIRKFFI